MVRSPHPRESFFPTMQRRSLAENPLSSLEQGRPRCRVGDTVSQAPSAVLHPCPGTPPEVRFLHNICVATPTVGEGPGIPYPGWVQQ